MSVLIKTLHDIAGDLSRDGNREDAGIIRDAIAEIERLRGGAVGLTAEAIIEALRAEGLGGYQGDPRDNFYLSAEELRSAIAAAVGATHV